MWNLLWNARKVSVVVVTEVPASEHFLKVKHNDLTVTFTICMAYFYFKRDKLISER